MIVQCDECKTKFRLDDSKVPEKGVKVRCSKCKNVFIVRREEAPPAESDAAFTGPAAGAEEPAPSPEEPSVEESKRAEGIPEEAPAAEKVEEPSPPQEGAEGAEEGSGAPGDVSAAEAEDTEETTSFFGTGEVEAPVSQNGPELLLLFNRDKLR